MVDRGDVLRELGLIPVWRLRSRPADVVPPPVLRDSVAATPSAPAPRAEERIVRIAALGWSDFAADVRACTACGLCRSRRQAVPGVGDAGAEWMFVGEAPGAEEDARGEPFVGQAGRLLDNMLAALGMQRTSNVYIANVLKCRPPGNRTPEPEEMETCGRFLFRQLEVIRPKAICALGGTAAKALLERREGVTRMRGNWYKWQDIPVMVTYHPSYLLRPYNQDAKREAWEDLKKVLHYVYD
jgi:DNA polymerase